MNLLPRTTPKTFNLLSVGQRGVGKTVFLAGSYAELHPSSQPDLRKQLWFDCQDSNVQENMERLLSYIVRTGQYPPSTLKITNFKFSLKRHSQWGTKTLSHFGWWDIPGESCNIDNPDFRKMVFNSSGCCVFIDAYALINQPVYRQALENIIQQVMPIATLVYLNSFSYAFALILTKCDLLEPGPVSQQKLKQSLQPLTSRLDAVKANYQTFYSDIRIVPSGGGSTLKATGAASPLLWLVKEVSKADNPGSMKNLLALVTRGRQRRLHPQQEGVAQSVQSLFSSAGKASRVKKIFGLYLFPTTRKYILLLAMAGVGLVGAIGLLNVYQESVLQRQAKNLDALKNVATLQQSGQFNQAVASMEKIVQQEPQRLDLRLYLAYLYELTAQVSKAETAYDQILERQKNNLEALLGKAQLRLAQGDTKTANALFAEAEKAAPAELKAKVRAVAQKKLASPTKPILPTK